jgi:hypothetical protein
MDNAPHPPGQWPEPRTSRALHNMTLVVVNTLHAVLHSRDGSR